MSRKDIKNLSDAIAWFNKTIWNAEFEYRYLTKNQKIILEQEIRQVADVLLQEKANLITTKTDKIIAGTGATASVLGVGALFAGPVIFGTVLTVLGASTTGAQWSRSLAKRKTIEKLEKYEKELKDFSKLIDRAMLLNNGD